MSEPLLRKTECDECGKTVEKIWRRYHGHRYCRTCYTREFARRICPKCGNYARLPRGRPDALCPKCETDKPCVRCGKIHYEIGKITPYGPVCTACSVYFRKAEPCEVCGRPSSRLTRVQRMGHDRRLCPRCARSDHEGCQACGRWRMLHESPDGRRLCPRCLEDGDIPCPTCGEQMPAGHGKQCQKCYWRALLEKRIAIDVAAFAIPAIGSHFDAFGRWLGKEVGEHKASLTIHRYLSFFVAIEHEWKEIPKYEVLLGHFGAARLRKVLLPMRWMEVSGLIRQDAEKKEADSERRRILATLELFGKGSQERKILVGYYDELQARGMKVRSIRLSLTPAAALLTGGKKRCQTPPDQKILEEFLDKAPGQRAAVSGFVRYLREKFGASMTLPGINARKEQANRRKKLEAEMLALMQEGGEGDEFRKRWLSVALAYFHGLPKRIGLLTESKDIHPDGEDGMSVMFDGKSYWVPARYR